MKVKKQKKHPSGAIVEVEEEEEEAPVVVTKKAHVHEPEPEEEAEPEAKVEKKKLPKVSASEADFVNFSMLYDIQPPPVVGSFNVGYELGITKMVAGKTYKVPMSVALVLLDSKQGVMA